MLLKKDLKYAINVNQEATKIIKHIEDFQCIKHDLKDLCCILGTKPLAAEMACVIHVRSCASCRHFSQSPLRDDRS